MAGSDSGDGGGLSDHVWSTKEWITYPAKPR